MATAYINQTPIISQVGVIQPGVVIAPFACNIASLKASFAGFIINDSVALVDIPNGAMLTDFFLDVCNLDSNVTPSLVWEIGDNVSASHGGAGAAGFVTGLQIGRGARGTIRAGGPIVSSAATEVLIAGQWVAGSIPFIYSIPNANIPTANVLKPGPYGAASLLMTITTAAATTTTTGTIYGWVAYTMLTQLAAATATGAGGNL